MQGMLTVPTTQGCVMLHIPRSQVGVGTARCCGMEGKGSLCTLVNATGLWWPRQPLSLSNTHTCSLQVALGADGDTEQLWRLSLHHLFARLVVLLSRWGHNWRGDVSPPRTCVYPHQAMQSHRWLWG